MSINYYPHHLGDYVKNTQQLSLLQHGAYRLLLDYYYTNEGPIPTDTKILYRICRCMNQHDRASVDYVLSKYFVPHDGTWHHGRADDEIKIMNDKSILARKSAESRWDKDMRTHMRTQCYPITNNQEPNSINIEEKKNGHARKSKSGGEEAARIADKIRKGTFDA